MIPSCFIRPTRSAVFLAAFSCLLTSSVLGQETGLSVGSRLRIAAPCPSESRVPAEPGPECSKIGGLVSLGDDSITLEASDTTYTYAISDLVHTEVSDGFRSHGWVGAGVGGGVGAVVTYLLLNTGGSTSLCDSSANQDATSLGLCLGLAAVGGLAGAGLGALVGRRITVEQWREVSLGSVRVGVRLRLNR